MWWHSNRDLAEIAVITHGPLDMALTLSHWHLESNPIVLSLGMGPWLALKAALCVGVVVGYLSTKESNSGTVRACLLFLALFGTIAVMGNLLVVGGVI